MNLSARLRQGMLRWLPRAVTDARVRSEYITRLREGSAHFQGSTFTLPDRFPLLFGECRRHLAEAPAPRLLSFGCSTGEEALSLRRVLPQAEITGVDVNRWCLRECRRRSANDPHLHFFHAASPEFAASGPFDAILALAVFQRTEHGAAPERIPRGSFRFEGFDRTLTMLAGKLKPGGLLFLDHCDFDFAQSTVRPHFHPLEFAGNSRMRERALYGRDNRLQARSHASPRGFRKLE